METTQKAKFSLEPVRKLYGYLSSRNKLSEFRDILSESDLDSDTLLLNLVESFKDGYCTPSDFTNGNIFYYSDSYYSSDDYCITREDEVCSMDEVSFCDYFEEHTSRSTYVVNIGRRQYNYCEDAISVYSRRKESLYEYNDEYYNYEALENYDLVLTEDTNIVMEMCDAYYNEEDGCYYEEEQEQYIREYHENEEVKFVKFTDEPKFFIGYEVEKEDQKVKESIHISDFESSCPLYRKEKDGSLSKSKGFELVSPCFELNTEKIAEHIKDDDIIMAHINAEYDTDTCGGHINISESNKTGQQLFENIQGYTPLIHALYYKRIDKRYSKGKSNKDLKDDNEKYQSVKIHRNRIEYRIISAVPNFDTLMWRTKLFEIILNNQTESVEKAFFNCFTILKKHLEEMYPSKEAFDKLMNRVINFTENYEGIILKRNNENNN